MSPSSRRRLLYLTKPYMQGDDVKQVQRRLDELGFEPFEIDGIYGPVTESAVMSLQRAKGLKVDGVVGPNTYRALGISSQEPGPDSPGSPEGPDSPEHPGSPPPGVGQPRGRISIEVDVDARQLTVFSDEEHFKTYPCAVGKPTTPSPLGKWHIVNKIVDPGGVLGTRWMGLNVPWGNYGIHGTNNPWSIGRWISLGCIRLHNQDVEEVFSWTGRGTPVTVKRSSGERPTLYPGSKGYAVASLQHRLAKLNYYHGSIDGAYESMTRAAVIRFQREYSLKVDGITGPETWGQLEKLTANKGD